MFESQFARRYVASQHDRPALRGDRVFWNLSRNGDTAELAIYDEIGFFGTSAAQFREQLASLDVESIRLEINSPGGDVFDGFAIYNMLRDHKARVDVVVNGMAASIATVIAMAGDSISVTKRSRMMVHNAWAVVIGPSNDMRKAADWLDGLSADIADIYAERSGVSASIWRDRMNEETWFRDQEAVEAKLVDRVVDTLSAPRNVFDLSMFVRPPVELMQTTANSAARTNQEEPSIEWRQVALEAVAEVTRIAATQEAAHGYAD